MRSFKAMGFCRRIALAVALICALEAPAVAQVTTLKGSTVSANTAATFLVASGTPGLSIHLLY